MVAVLAEMASEAYPASKSANSTIFAVLQAPRAGSDALVRKGPAPTRVILIDALRDAHRWLDELLSDPLQTLELLALRGILPGSTAVRVTRAVATKIRRILSQQRDPR